MPKICAYTNTGHKLKVNEDKFISIYVETGNGTQSYIEAFKLDKLKKKGYTDTQIVNIANEKSYQLRRRDYISEEILFRQSQIQQKSIANATEILQFFTRVMKGEEKDQFGLEATLGDRIKAAQELAKRQIDIPQKLAQNVAPDVKITLDWSIPDQNVIDTEAKTVDFDINDEELHTVVEGNVNAQVGD